MHRFAIRNSARIAAQAATPKVRPQTPQFGSRSDGNLSVLTERCTYRCTHICHSEAWCVLLLNARVLETHA